ncbi:MAG: hypothetical protein ACI82O_003619 [Patiriisocius sp.]|jgi:hypothetical protein
MITIKAPLKLCAKLLQKTSLTITSALIVSTLLSACGDSVVQSGVGAGDTAEDVRIQAAIALLQPYVGIYLLQDDWNGGMGDVAYLSIGLTANDGISEAALIDFDDIDNCVPERFFTGVVRKDDFSNRVFMDDILEFVDAELSLSANNLIIQVTGSATINATRVDTSLVDLGVTCS